MEKRTGKDQAIIQRRSWIAREGKMLLGIWKRDIAVAMLSHEAITSLIYKNCLLVQNIEICNLVLEGLQSTFTYL